MSGAASIPLACKLKSEIVTCRHSLAPMSSVLPSLGHPPVREFPNAILHNHHGLSTRSSCKGGLTLGAATPMSARVDSRPPSSYSMRLLSRVSSEMWSTVCEPMVWPSSRMRCSSACTDQSIIRSIHTHTRRSSTASTAYHCWISCC